MAMRASCRCRERHPWPATSTFIPGLPPYPRRARRQAGDRGHLDDQFQGVSGRRRAASEPGVCPSARCARSLRNPPSPYDPTDAVYAAARDLCANGAGNGANLAAALYVYDHASWYVTEVLDLAHTYGQTRAQNVAAGAAGGIAVDWALAQVGTPYVWGGETLGVDFDCSGLVQAAYKAAGITLPRVAQNQYDAAAKLGPGDPLQPGDLVFFSNGPTDVTHVGIYIGNSQMVDAPHTGADVRVEPTPTTPGATWGDEVVAGVTDPAA